MVWSKSLGGAPRVYRAEPSQTERKRHLRKYAEGSLPEERSFYFRGPEGKLKLRAPNLILFMDLADGVDDDTWLFHLKKKEVSEWFRNAIRDESIADEVASIEQQSKIDPAASRQRIRELIEKKYTLPGSATRRRSGIGDRGSSELPPSEAPTLHYALQTLPLLSAIPYPRSPSSIFNTLCTAKTFRSS